MEVAVRKNIDLGKTRITDKVRVSSAAIWYEEMFGNYYQLETWIFSDDERQKSVMVIHGTSWGSEIPQKLIDKTKKVHKYLADNMNKKFNQ